ncbi:hypothetical protein DA075_03195 [Methylobacterium currus]|uniref:Uncharacterized protein n=1 Tax=Methylobacterium currus TaxID=2051553 RepID=A0A2R4WEU1_9HYPH|nr:hypothetical protein [Methylobacterium currus]AWB20063.1 hypothetical protein DA075_03195 [Methylobacterium currus]
MSDGAFDSGLWPNPARGGDDAVSGGSLSLRRLREIEAVLGVSIDPASAAGPEQDGGRVFERQAIDLLRAFNRITDPEARRAVLRLVSAAAHEVAR